MKKFLFITAMVVLVLSLGITAFAYDYGGNNLSDSISVNGQLQPLVEWYKSASYPDMVLFASSVGTYRLYVAPTGSFFVDGKSMYSRNSYYSFEYDYQNGYWIYSDTLLNTNGQAVISDTLYLDWSAQDLYTKSGTLYLDADENFRLPPLSVVVQRVTEEEMPQFLYRTGGTMTTLLLCGVGLMTLLVLLAIFSKLFAYYRA